MNEDEELRQRFAEVYESAIAPIYTPPNQLHREAQSIEKTIN